MKRLLTALAIALSIAAPAHAETYTYACKAKDGSEQFVGDSRLHSAKLDIGKNTFTFLGKVYRNVKQQESCEAKACFGNDRVTLEVATQGVASLSILFGTGPGDDGVMELDCDQVLK